MTITARKTQSNGHKPDAVIDPEGTTMPSMTTKPSPEEMTWLKNKLNQVLSGLDSVVIGQPEVTRLLVCALALENRSVLLEGPPGLAKTVGAKALAKLIAGELGRVQGTHDLLASDITGYSVPKQSETGGFAGFVLRKGPIFSQVFFLDDMSRASEKALSGTIEALEEGQATIDGQTHPLPKGQVRISNMNPTEHSGTNQVPDATLDRHAGYVEVPYPDEDDEVDIALGHTSSVSSLQPVISEREILRVRNIVARIRHTCARNTARRAVKIVRATADSNVFIRRASPRASQDTMMLAAVSAALRGSNEINSGDIKMGALYAIPHRLEFDPEFAMNNPDMTPREWIANQTI